ncbi:MAG: hypothetical protein CUN55_20790, partial [Phototrophicales bacterium]
MAAVVSTETNRLSVVGDSDVVSDEFLANSLENKAFVSNMIDWVMADDVLTSIPLRAGGRNVFVFSSSAQLSLVQYATIFLPSILIAGYGIY